MKITSSNHIKVILGLAISALIFANGCAAPKPKTVTSPNAVYVEPDANVLRVGVSTNAPPLIYKQGPNITGLEAELAREFAKYLGKTVHFTELDWEDQIPALLDDRIDIIMSGMSITRMRQYRIAFSRPYFRSGQMALVRKQDSYRYDKGYYMMTSQYITVGVVKGTTGEFFVRDNFHTAKDILTFPDSKQGALALINRQIDMLIHDAPIILILASQHEIDGLVPVYSLLTEEYLAWGLRKDDLKLLESANAFINESRRDGSLDRMIGRWIPFMK